MVGGNTDSNPRTDPANSRSRTDSDSGSQSESNFESDSNDSAAGRTSPVYPWLLAGMVVSVSGLLYGF